MLTWAALDTQGLLRQPGTYGKIEALKRRLDNGWCSPAACGRSALTRPGMLKNYDSIDLSKEDPHDVAGALRHYFAELPEPLIPFEYYEQFMEVQRAPCPLAQCPLAQCPLAQCPLAHR